MIINLVTGIIIPDANKLPMNMGAWILKTDTSLLRSLSENSYLVETFLFFLIFFDVLYNKTPVIMIVVIYMEKRETEKNNESIQWKVP